MENMRSKTNNITSICETDLSNFGVDTAASFSLYIPLNQVKGDAERIVEECMKQYKSKYPDVDIEKDIHFDFHLIHCINFDCEPEFSAGVYIWLKDRDDCSDDQCEVYENIPVTLTEDAKQAVKRIIVKKLMENGLTE